MANTVDVSKLGFQVVVGTPDDTINVSKVALQEVVGPGADQQHVSKIALQIVVGPEASVTELIVSQVPLLLVIESSQPVRVSQLPMLLVNLPEQATKVSQLPILPVFTSKPTPTPLPMIPEVPVIETWKWETAVNISESGKEQRVSLRSKPRIDLSFDVILLNETHRRNMFKMMFENSALMFSHPLYQYSVKLQSGATSSDTNLYFDPAKTDMREGETIVIFDPNEDDDAVYAIIDSVEADGVILSEAVGSDIPEYYMVAPAPTFYFTTSPSISMNSIDGSTTMKIITQYGREQLRPDQSVSLTSLDSIPILTKRPLANDEVEEAFNHNVTVLDNSTAPAELRTNWVTPFISGNRKFLAQRPTDMDYWRKFGDTVKGKRTPFLFPTWRDDLPLSSVPVLGATIITTSNTHYAKYFKGVSSRYLMIRSSAGTIYRRVLDIHTNYDLNGVPSTIDMILASSIGAGAGANQNMVVSIMNLCRLDSDEIVLEHYDLDTIVSFEVRTVDA